MSDAFKPLLAKLADGATLNEETAEAFFAACLRGEPTPAQIAAAVTAMRMRGEAISEIVACARAMRAAAVTLEHGFDVVDTCGTGGDGAETLNISLANLKDYGYVGVFSSGLLFRDMAQTEKDLAGKVSDKDAPKLLWFATGSKDFLLKQSKDSVDLLKKLGLNPVFKETEGGHTWINWHDYLNEFAPQLFQ